MVIRFARRPRPTLLAAAAGAIALPAVAQAQCTPDATGLNVTCSGSSAAYTNVATGVNVTVVTGATVTAPLVIGTSGTLTNAGTISGTAAIPAVQYGDNATITNNGTISSAGSLAGSAAISVGNNGSVTNTATLTATAGTPVASFASGGSFTNTATSTVAVSGNVTFGASINAAVSTFNNANVTYGFVGSVTALGNANLTNTGLWTGSFIQTAVGTSTVNFTNGTAGVFSGVVDTGNQSAVVNNGIMSITSSSTIGISAGAVSTLANLTPVGSATGAALTLGSITSPASVQVNGSFVQNAGSTLNVAITTPGAVGPVSSANSVNYSSIYAQGGTATLAGNLGLNVAAGFYPTGSIYKIVVADNGITGTFSQVLTNPTTTTTTTNGVTTTTTTSTPLPFIAFVPIGVVTVAGTQQAYELQVVRTQTYAQALAAGGGTKNEIAIATGVQPALGTGLVATATAAPSTDAAALVGEIDVLTTPQAITFFDSVSPEAYAAYGTALRDQANALTRTVALRMQDQNSRHGEDGWWLTPYAQHQFSSPQNEHTRENSFGIAGGYDLSGPEFVAGLAGQFSTDSLRYASEGYVTGHNRDLAIDAYGAYVLGPVRLSGQAAYHFGHLGATKTIDLGSFSRTANAATGEHAFKLTGTGSFDLVTYNVLFQPFGGIDYLNGKVSGFVEQNADTADLTVNGFSITRTDLIAGATITRATGHFRPYVKGMYRSQLGSTTGNVISAYFNGDPTTSFSVTALAEPRHEVDADGGINWVFEDAGSLYLGYQGTYRGHFNTHGVNLGIRLEF